MSLPSDRAPHPQGCQPDLAIRGLSGLLTASMEFDDVLHSVVELAGLAVPATGCAVTFLIDRTETRTEGSDAAARRLADQALHLEEGPAVDASRDGATVCTGDVHRDGRWPVFGRRAAGSGIRSVLSVGLPPDGAPVAVVTFFSAEHDAFSAEHIRAAESFAEAAGAVLANARTANQLRAHNENLTLALTSRAVIDQAIGIIRSRTGTTADEAFRRLRSISQREHIKVGEVARQTVDDAVKRTRVRLQEAPAEDPRGSAR